MNPRDHGSPETSDDEEELYLAKTEINLTAPAMTNYIQLSVS